MAHLIPFNISHDMTPILPPPPQLPSAPSSVLKAHIDSNNATTRDANEARRKKRKFYKRKKLNQSVHLLFTNNWLRTISNVYTNLLINEKSTNANEMENDRKNRDNGIESDGQREEVDAHFIGTM